MNTFNAGAKTGVYNFSTGLITSINPSETFQNEPYVVDVAGSYSYWTARYFYTDASAGSTANTVTVSFSNAVQHTSFTGVVTFSGGTFNQNGSAIYDTTTIDGDHITTGTVKGAGYDVTGQGGAALIVATAGLASGDAVFDVKKADRSSVFKITKAGDITAESFTLNSGIIAGGVTIGSGGPALSTAQTNTSNKTGGQVGGWAIASTTITGTATNSGRVTIDSGNKRILIEEYVTNQYITRVKLGNLS